VKLRATLRFALPLAVVLSTGCYGAKVLRQPIAADKTEKNVQTLVEQQAILQDEIAELRATIARQEEMIRSLRADTQSRLDELTENVDAVGSRVKDSFDRPDVYYSVPSEPQDYRRSPTLPAYGDSASAPQSLTPAQIKAIYDNAYLDLNRGNYSLALIGFQDYLSRNPDSDLSDNAQYWIGECYYAQRDFRRAIEELGLVDRDYPLGDKVPASLLKIGYSHLQLDDREAAKEVLRDLINRFPTSDEAAQARAKIRTLD
jgi:tol-pal system protein YbgF